MSKLVKERLQRITEKKKILKSKKERKLMKYSNTFHEMFNFFLKSYRCGILNFCGSNVDVKFNILSDDARFSFRIFDNGNFRGKQLESVHSNIFKAVLIGKKSWGLFCREWSLGISECDFTKEEILSQFEENNIKIPDVLITELDNEILNCKIKRYESYLNNKQ